MWGGHCGAGEPVDWEWGLSSALSPQMILGSSIPPWHFIFLYCRMSLESNDTRSKILKYQCPRFALLQSFQTQCGFGSHPNWFTAVFSKTILLKVWHGTSLLFRACKSALIVLSTGHANFHLGLLTAPLLAPPLDFQVCSFFCSTSSTNLPLTLTCS